VLVARPSGGTELATGRSEELAAAPPEHPALFSTLPVTREERVWDFFGFSWVMIGLAVATWAFLIGGEVVEFLGLQAGIAAMVVGNAIGVGLVVASVLGNTKYGLEHFSLVRAVFGRQGVKPLIYIVNFLVTVGWSGILAVMFGRAGVNIVNQVAGTAYHGDHFLVALFGLAALFATWVVVVKGPVALKSFNRVAAPGLAVVIVLMLVFLLGGNRWSELTAIQPLNPVGAPVLNFILVVEFSIAGGLSWWPAQGNLSRLATTQRSALWASVVGLFVVTILAQTVGLMAALVHGSSDPTTWMIPLTGAGFGILILTWIGFANITTMSVQAYQVSVAMRQESVTWLSRMSWPLLVAIFLGLSALFLIKPSAVYDNFFRFLYWISLVYAPIIGIVLVDYFVLRRQTLDLRAIFSQRIGDPYDFWGGWNMAAFIALGFGVGVYLSLLNPVSLWHSAPFPYMTASVPSLLTGGLVHLVLTRLWVKRSGRGGYRR
jgi:nucleobase:cation symporter-1, NCS1 family